MLFRYIRDRLLAPGGVFVLEHPPRLDPAAAAGLEAPGDTRTTAGSAVSFWDAPPPAPPF